MTLSLTLDLIVIALLVATIAYAFILNRKLATLHDSKEELRHFLETFAESLGQAKSGVEYLKKVSLDSSKDLQEKIRQAKALRDELGFFVDNGEKTITKLETYIQATRASLDKVRPLPADPMPKGSKASSVSTASSRPAVKAPQPRVEPKLVQALRGLR